MLKLPDQDVSYCIILRTEIRVSVVRFRPWAPSNPSKQTTYSDTANRSVSLGADLVQVGTNSEV